MNKIIKTCIIFCVALTSWGQEIPSSSDPSRIDKRFEQPPIPASKPLQLQEQPRLPQPQKAQDINITLKSIQLNGMSVYQHNELLQYWQEKLNKQITIKELFEIADKITADYRNDGWILSQAVLEPQDITKGDVTIKVMEGFADQVLIEGDILGYGKFFAEYIEKIKAAKPLNNSVLEKYSLLASELPGINVKAVIRPSKTVQGASDVVFVIERKMLEGYINYDNRGTKPVGPNQLGAYLAVAAPFGLPDRLSIRYNTIPMTPEELKYIAVSDDHIFTAEGLNLSTTVSRSNSKPGGRLEQLHLVSKSRTITSQLSYPLIKSRAKNLSIWGGFSWSNSDSDIDGIPLQRDRGSKIRLGTKYDFADTSGAVTMFYAEYHRGLRAFNSSKKGDELVSRADGHGDYNKFTLDITRTQPLINAFSLMAGLTSQLSDKALFSGEEFGFGGAQYGRAYDSSEIIGDSGVAGKLELSYTYQPPIKGIQSMQPYTFYDIGEIFDRSNGQYSAASAGVGMRIALLERFSGSLEWTQPLTKEVNANLPGNGQKSRVFFSLMGRF